MYSGPIPVVVCNKLVTFKNVENIEISFQDIENQVLKKSISFLLLLNTSFGRNHIVRNLKIEGGKSQGTLNY